MRTFDRRQFATMVAASGATALLPGSPTLAAGLPLETTTIRLRKTFAICFAPFYVVTEFLKSEGFEDIQYVEAENQADAEKMVEAGEMNIALNFAGTVLSSLDKGTTIATLGGLHVGCYELFAREPIDSVSDLKGKRVGINDFGRAEYLYISMMANYVGIDPEHEIEWVTGGREAMEMFIAGETDAFLGFPPEPQILRARGHDRVILNTVLDRPWSQYFCCVIFSGRDWLRAHPVATKRALRAIYRAADFCTSQPEKAAQRLVDDGFVERYEYALETIREIPYDLWHEYDVEDTMRFFALRLHDVGMLKTPPNKLLAEGTEWRFLEELKREMKT